jgi:DNA polymerase III epsilon subunit-like protein
VCSQCKKAFDASHKLDNHLKATKHALRYIEPNPAMACNSATGLVRHMAAADHSAHTQSTIQAPARQSHDGIARNSMQLFLCTEANCKKTFKTKRARAQHLDMAMHGKPVMKTTAQQDKKALSLPSQSQLAASESVQFEAGDTVKAMTQGHPTHTETKIQPHQSVPKQETSIAAPAQRSAFKPSKLSAQKSLFPWDTRWSAIPSAQHSVTYSALALTALTPNLGSTDRPWKGKEFYAPDIEFAPGLNPKAPRQQAICLDCEMVGVGHKGLTSALARVSAIDFFTGVLLVNTLVEPLLDVKDWRTQWSGITAKAMEEAVASGKVLKGSSAARAELFKFMDSQTILVGHSLQFDLAALGIRHEATVDSSILAKSAVGRGVKREWALKTLCKELLKITVQDNGKNGHDAVEDALAAREVVLWCLQHNAELKSWGEKKRKEHFKKLQMKGRPVVPRRIYESDSDDGEFLCLSTKELNELCHFPEWYDNWD